MIKDVQGEELEYTFCSKMISTEDRSTKLNLYKTCVQKARIFVCTNRSRAESADLPESYLKYRTLECLQYPDILLGIVLEKVLLREDPGVFTENLSIL